MTDSKKIVGTAEAWESGELGMDINTVQQISAEEQAHVDAALGIELVSIRLPMTLVSELTEAAKDSGIGLRPLIRCILQEYINTLNID